jgi:hypothetical protein
VEQDDDKYKWNIYQVEKQALLDEDFRADCKPPKQQGIDIGRWIEPRPYFK